MEKRYLILLVLFASFAATGPAYAQEKATGTVYITSEASGSTKFTSLHAAIDYINANPSSYNSTVTIRIQKSYTETYSCEFTSGKTFNIVADGGERRIFFTLANDGTYRAIAITQGTTVNLGNNGVEGYPLRLLGTTSTNVSNDAFTPESTKVLFKLAKGGVLNIYDDVELAYGKYVIWVEQQGTTTNGTSTLNMYGGVVHSASDVCINLSSGNFNMYGGYVCGHYKTTYNTPIPYINVEEGYNGNAILDYDYVATQIGDSPSPTRVANFLTTYYGKAAGSLNQASGVYMHFNGTNNAFNAAFNMYGGNFCGLYAIKSHKPYYTNQVDLGGNVSYGSNVGGAVIYVNDSRTLNITSNEDYDSPRIFGCVSASGAIRINDVSSTGKTNTNTLSGGEISYCQSNGFGGAIAIQNGRTLTLSGISISKNIAATTGGAVHVAAGCTLIMAGGSITGNNAGTNGGGIYKLGSMRMKGSPIVKGNTVVSKANNVYIPADATEKHIVIDYPAAIDCGAYIGVTKTDTEHTYTDDSYTEITKVRYTNPASSLVAPFFEQYMSRQFKCEFVLPKEMLEGLQGKTISSMVFYRDDDDTRSWGNVSIRVFMMTQSANTISSYAGYSSATTVFNSTGLGNNSERNKTVNFTSNYNYTGDGNLLIGIYKASATPGTDYSDWKSKFIGISQSGTCIAGTTTTGTFSNCNATQRNFLPKVTFNCTDGTSWTFPDDAYTGDYPQLHSNHYFFDDTQVCDVYTDYVSPAYDNSDSHVLYFVKNADGNNSWLRQAPTAVASTDYTLNTAGTHVKSIHTGKGLAYFASQVLSGMDYAGKTVILSSDIDLSGYNWEPAGFCAECGDEGTSTFAGTFDGQGHTIYDLNCNYDYKNVGLFGHVTGTVKNVIVSGTVGGTATNLGGIAGEVGDGGEIYNSISTVSPISGTNFGSFVGKINRGGSLKNSYAYTTCTNGLVGANEGLVENCYVRGATNLVGSNTGNIDYCYGPTGTVTTGTNRTFSEVVTPYVYALLDNQVASDAISDNSENAYIPTANNKSLVATLNNWVNGSDTYAQWARPNSTAINGDYPLLKMPGQNAVAANNSTPNELHYGDINALIDDYDNATDAIYLYGSKENVSSNSGSAAELFIDEDAAITQTGDITANVAVTLRNAIDGTPQWHMFSPAIANAPLGLNYVVDGNDENVNNEAYQVAFGTVPTHYPHTGAGYFPTVDDAYYGEWDYYTYYEPAHHWINFKRNGISHWEQYEPHNHIDYQATPSASVNVNEATMIPGKGYLMAVQRETMLQCQGTLNNNTTALPLTIALTKEATYRTGYNFLGNPYQSYLDFDAFAENSSNIQLWEDNAVENASYVILDKYGYTNHAYDQSENTFGASQYLHPHQGFMVVVKGDATQAHFDNTMRVTNASTAFRGTRINYPLVNLIAYDHDGQRDITTVELGRSAKGGARKHYDLHSGKGCLYTRYDNKDYAVAFTQPGISEVGVWFEADEDGVFTLTWDTENGDFNYLHLIDNLTGTDMDCLAENEYRFMARMSDYKSRFRLMFGYTGIEEPEVPEPVEGSTGFAFQMGNQIVVNGEGQLDIIDMLGRVIDTRQLNGGQSKVATPSTSGIYVLRLSNSNATLTQKIAIR